MRPSLVKGAQVGDKIGFPGEYGDARLAAGSDYAFDLEEGVSTRGLIHAAKLMKRGINPKRACSLAIAQTVTDEKEEIAAIEIIIDKIFR